MLSREKPVVKPMAPGSIFIILIFQHLVISFVLFYVLVIFYIYLYQISSLQVTVRGLTTPLSRWVQVFDCLCRCIDWRLVRTSYWIDTLVLKTEGNTYASLLHHPFLFKGKPTQCSRGSTFAVEALSFRLRSRLGLLPLSSNLLAVLLEVPLLPFALFS